MDKPLIGSDSLQHDTTEKTRSRAYTPKITHLKSWEFAGKYIYVVTCVIRILFITSSL